MMKLLVKTVKTPVITFEPNNATVQTFASVTAYAIQPNATLTPLFVLNLVGYTAGVINKKPFVWFYVGPCLTILSLQDSSVSARVFVSGTRLAGAVTLNK